MWWLQQVPKVLIRTGILPSTQIPAQILTQVLHKHNSVKVTLLPDIAYEELTQKLEGKKVTLIDVRTPEEHVQDGMIPDAKNLPLKGFGLAILEPDEDFAAKQGFSKPALDEPIVVSCLLGIRARTAQLSLIGAGYTNVRMYAGSFEDWKEKGGKVVFPVEES